MVEKANKFYQKNLRTGPSSGCAVYVNPIVTFVCCFLFLYFHFSKTLLPSAALPKRASVHLVHFC